ncbi:hypothetical protein BVY01_00485 [bacterium I07]|nr:hypothetical protein BVY01_00485 [bacterium I07]
MKQIRLAILLILTIILGLSAQEKQAVAVLDFETIGVSETHYGRVVGEMFSTELSNTNEFMVVERTQIGKIVEEHQFQLTGAVSEETAVEIGKLVGANIVVVGSLSKMGETYNILARFVNCQSSEIILSKSGTAQDVNVIGELVSNMVANLVDKTKGFEKQIKNPRTAFLYSLVLPGAGQAYAGMSKKKIWLFALGAAFGWALVVHGQETAKEAGENADKLYALDPSGGDPEHVIWDSRSDEFLTASGWKKERQTSKNVSLIMAIFSTGLHVWSALDAAGDARRYNREKGFRVSFYTTPHKSMITFSKAF